MTPVEWASIEGFLFGVAATWALMRKTYRIKVGDVEVQAPSESSAIMLLAMTDREQKP